MRLFGLSTVRGRLLGLMASIVLPIALLSVILATTTFYSVTKSIEASQLQTASDYAVRSRIWFRGAWRALTAASVAVRGQATSSEQCSAAAALMLKDLIGFEALYIEMYGGIVCYASRMPSLTLPIVAEISNNQAEKAFLQPTAVIDFGNTRYDSVHIDNKLHLIAHVDDKTTLDKTWHATVLIDPDLLDGTFDAGSIQDRSIVALVKRGQKVLVARGIDENATDWLPDKELSFETPKLTKTVSQTAEVYTYATHMVAEPDMYVLARFDNASARAAFTQFLILCLTPLVTLLVLFGAYAWAIQTNILQWIKGIEAAARAKNNSQDRLAPIAAVMPKDIRLVAEAFNSMVLEADKREASLRATLDANHYLMRELNHRVKNSLQVIQSYIALSRRQQPSGESMHLAETEAKVQVLSTAYRLALHDGSMRPVQIKIFTQEIISNLSSYLRRSNQWIESSIEADAGLLVDRTIPVGLAIVEGVIAGLRATNSTIVRVDLCVLEDGYLQLRIASNGDLANCLPPKKIMAGLAAQIEATVHSCRENEVLKWTFRA
jgi:two-component system, sensor histidine kinase PdtaS